MKFFKSLAVAFIALAVSACGQSDDSNVIIIGTAGPMTGENAAFG